MEIIKKDMEELISFGKKHNNEYNHNLPFPNIFFENFFNADFLDKVLDEFPDLSKTADHKFDNQNEVKLATKGEYKLGENARLFVHYLNSQPFLDFLSALTGIDNLLPDPTLAGGGYHEIKPGGFLKIHSDFNKHPDYKLDRRLNILVYLNKDWQEEYGGHFELWNKEMTECVKKITPHFNTMALFSTTSKSYHGHPNKLACPPDRSRKSIALYYYTNGRPQHEVEEFLEEHSTIFRARTGIDNTEETEKYLTERLKKEKKERLRYTFISAAKAITPPVFWNAMKRLYSK